MLLVVALGLAAPCAEEAVMDLTPDALVKLLFTYGPFALVVFFIYVAEGKARTAMKEADAKAKIPTTVVYLGVWAVVFGLVVFAAVAWGQMNLKKQPMLKGSFENLAKDENVFFQSNQEMYLKRLDNSDGTFIYEWRWYPQSDTGSIPFTFSRGAESGKFTRHAIPLRPEYYNDKASVRIEYRRKQDKLVLASDYNGQHKEEVLASLDEAPTVTNSSIFGWFGGTVHASDTKLSPQAMMLRLESANPEVRAAARRDLAAQGAHALPLINRILEDPDSSLNLRVGAMAALNQMRGPNLSGLSPEAWSAIQRAAQAGRPLLQAEAQRFLKNNRPPVTASRAPAAAGKR